MDAPAEVSVTLDEIEQQLLMAALIWKWGPATDLKCANTVTFVNQVLRWRGLYSEQIKAGWCGGDGYEADDKGDDWPARHPEHSAVYATLIRMTHQRCRDGTYRPGLRYGPALFEGAGNWGVPGDESKPACSPYFSSCRLTALGEAIAKILLSQHPGYHSPDEAGNCPA